MARKIGYMIRSIALWDIGETPPEQRAWRKKSMEAKMALTSRKNTRGKMQSFKSLIVYELVYVAMLPKNAIDHLQAMNKKFIWDS